MIKLTLCLSRERIRAKDKTIEILEEKVVDTEQCSMDELEMANCNDNYSRKHNIRVMRYPEKEGEKLADDFVKLVKKDLDVELDKSESKAIHRIPGKAGFPRPVIVKSKKH